MTRLTFDRLIIRGYVVVRCLGSTHIMNFNKQKFHQICLHLIEIFNKLASEVVRVNLQLYIFYYPLQQIIALGLYLLLKWLYPTKISIFSLLVLISLLIIYHKYLFSYRAKIVKIIKWLNIVKTFICVTIDLSCRIYEKERGNKWKWGKMLEY